MVTVLTVIIIIIITIIIIIIIIITTTTIISTFETNRVFPKGITNQHLSKRTNGGKNTKYHSSHNH